MEDMIAHPARRFIRFFFMYESWRVKSFSLYCTVIPSCSPAGPSYCMYGTGYRVPYMPVLVWICTDSLPLSLSFHERMSSCCFIPTRRDVYLPFCNFGRAIVRDTLRVIRCSLFEFITVCVLPFAFYFCIGARSEDLTKNSKIRFT